MNKKYRDLLEVSCMYVITGVVGWWVATITDSSLILKAGVADLVMTVMIFACSLWKTNSSAYDAYWSVIPFYLVVWLFMVTDGNQWNWMQWLTMLVVSVWSWRLTLNWARGWAGWQHEDWRYVDFRNEHGGFFQVTNFFGIHLIPTIIVFLASLGLFAVATADTFNIWLMLSGIFVGSVGVALEYIADNQLHAFRQRPAPKPDDLLDTGIWGIIRYPNYLGELLFWWGVALCGIGAGAELWTLTGIIVMMALFAFASIPMKDKRMASRRPGYEAYRQRVPALVPWF
jgi:steroid 5-alpha reductase family enzyme